MTGATGGANKEVDEKIILLSEKISALVQEAETAGCAGNVEQVSTKIGKPNKMGIAITFYFQRIFSRTIKLSKHLNTVGLT